MAGVEQNRYKTNNGCIKHLPQTGLSVLYIRREGEELHSDPTFTLSLLLCYVECHEINESNFDSRARTRTISGCLSKSYFSRF